MKGCVLYGRYVFANDDKNRRLTHWQAREEGGVGTLAPLPLPESS